MPTPSRENPPFGATALAVPRRDTAAAAAAAAVATGAIDPDDAMRFRAPTLEDAIAVAETSLGARVRVIAANRIRRGGIGGFFAADLGVEVTVVVDDESIDDTFERIVNATKPTAPAPSAPPAPPAPLHAADLLLGRRFDRRDTAPAADLVAELDDRFDDEIDDEIDDVVHVADVGRVDHAGHAGHAGDADHAGDAAAVHEVNPVLAEVLAALMAEAAEKQALAVAAADASDVDVLDAHLPVEPPAPRPAAGITAPTAAPTRPIDAPPTMLRVEQIMAELSAITAEPVFGGRRQRARVLRPTLPAGRRDAAEVEAVEADERVEADVTDAAPQRPKVLPTLPPRPSEIAQRASQAAHDARQRLFATPSLAARPVVAGTTGEPAPVGEVAPAGELAGADDPVAVGTTTEPTPAPIDEIRAEVAIDRDPTADIDAGADAAADERRGRAGAAVPSRRQVELAVAAADQLIESLKRDDGVKRLSVRVVLRSGDQRAVEAEAEWEAS